MLRVITLVFALTAIAVPASAATVNLASFGTPATETITLANPGILEILLTSFGSVQVSAGSFLFSSPGPVAAATFAGIDVPAGDITFSLSGPLAAATFNISEVPLPGALVLLGSGLAGLAYMRRRRSLAA